MRKASIPLSDLKKSACAGLNQKAFEDLEKPDKQRKKRVPSMPCQQVLWMGGQLAAWALESGIMVEREYKFHPERKWRADFAIPDKKILVEYEGINSEKSRHTTITGYTGDSEKYNAAQAFGFKVLRFTCRNYKTVIKELDKLVNSEQ